MLFICCLGWRIGFICVSTLWQCLGYTINRKPECCKPKRKQQSWLFTMSTRIPARLILTPSTWTSNMRSLYET
jgi:hypothetical protein